jgi:hypothetical protein
MGEEVTGGVVTGGDGGVEIECDGGVGSIMGVGTEGM